MKLNCEIIKDLIPQCVDEIASDDSVNLVMEHILTCESCRNEYEKQKNYTYITNNNQVQTLIKIQKKLKRNKNRIIVITFILTLLLFLVVYILCFLQAIEKNHFIIMECMLLNL